MKFKSFSWLLMSLFFLSFYTAGEAFADAYTITDEKFGGDCSQIGTWDAVTNTCTLSTDITSSERNPSTIIIGANDITLNGDKHTISSYGALGSRGIIVNGKSGVTIKNITVNDFYYGVFVDSSNHCTISRVTAIQNEIGIGLDSSTICTISNSTASLNATGISVLLSDSSTLSGNTSSQNKIGVKLIDSQSISFTGNSIQNSIDDGSSFAGTGVLIENSAYNTFQENTFSDNDTHGCWLHNESNFNTFSGNAFTNNAAGLNLRDTASNNAVYGNYFLTNTPLQAYDRGTNNVFHTVADGGNHWSDYDSQSEGCADRYIDGYCDAPYTFTNNEDAKPISVRDFAYEISAGDGGDCSLLGSWEESTLTCTLTGPVNVSGDGIVILDDNITLNGNGNAVRGNSETGTIGVFVSGLNGVTLRNLDVSQFDMGVALSSSNSCKLTNNTIANNVKGIAGFSASDNMLTNSFLSQNSEVGIEFFYNSDSNTISGNGLQANGYGVIFNANTSDNKVYDNDFVNNTLYPAVDSGAGNVFYTLTDGGNHWDGYDTADEGCHDIDFNGFCDTSYIIDPPLGVDVEDHMAIAPRSWAYTITPDGGDCGIIGSWEASSLTCTLANAIDVSVDGILIEGDNITLDGNSQTITGARVEGSAGVVAKGSDNVTVRGITVLDFDTGLAFVNSANGILENSSISLNRVGVLLYSTVSSVITNSTVSQNSDMGLLFSNGADLNTVYDNAIQANGHGVVLNNGVADNIFYGNHFLGNSLYPAVDSGTGNAFFTAVDGGNYWDNHDTPEEGCDDIDFNGLCDNSYIMDPLLGNDIEDNMAIALRGNYPYTITSDGGDCSLIGTWDQANLTCTLNDEVVFSENGIYIADDNIILDGNGHAVTGSDLTGSVGIFVSDADGVVIRNATLSKFDAGIAFSSANNCLLENSTIEHNQKGVNASAATGNHFKDSVISQNSFAGIYLLVGANSNTISGNTFQTNNIAIGFDGSNNIIYKNYFEGDIGTPVFDLGSDNVFYSPTEGGNHWGTYDTPDEGCNDTDYDGLCDAPFILEVDISFISFTIEDPMPIAPSDYSYIITSGDGGDCSLIGAWEPSSLTCTMNRDVTTVSDGIYIADDNIILNGNNRSITGPATSGTAGIVVFDVNNVVIQNITVSQFDTGVTFSSANNFQLYNSTISTNTYGVNVYASSNSLLTGSTIANNSFAGLAIYDGADSNIVSNNKIQGNLYGVLLDSGSSNNTLYRNYFAGDNAAPTVDMGTENVYFTAFEGGNHWDAYDTSTEGCDDIDYDGYCDAPYTVETIFGPDVEDQMPISPRDYNYIITSDGGGDCSSIGIWYEPGLSCALTTDIYVTGNGIKIADDNILFAGNGHTLSGSDDAESVGITISGQSGATVRNLTITNFATGIKLSSVSGTLVSNTVLDEFDRGMHIEDSTANTFLDNYFDKFGAANGFFLLNSDNNVFQENTILFANDALYLGNNSDRNTITENIFIRNILSLFLDRSDNNIIYKNEFFGGGHQEILNTGTDNLFFTGLDGGNHWEVYDSPDEGCYDANADGYCDDSFVIDAGASIDEMPIAVPVSVVPCAGDLDGDFDIDGTDLVLWLTNGDQTVTLADLATHIGSVNCPIE